MLNMKSENMSGDMGMKQKQTSKGRGRRNKYVKKKGKTIKGKKEPTVRRREGGGKEWNVCLSAGQINFSFWTIYHPEPLSLTALTDLAD